ncbi:hypothetical protein GQ42DRAFT_161872 [Ramicandelaber brevisporus]|nr:hypothetical protein GQ42DRAFT_161872 [Ramicandelaber brevisporus]
MSFEYTYVLAGYDNLNEGKWAIVHASQDDGPWNGFLYGFFWSVTSLVFRVVLGILAFTGCYELYRHFKVFGFHLSFRVLVYLGSVFTLVVAIIIGAIARRSNGGSGLLYFSWVVEYVCFTVVSLRWLNYVQAVRATPKLLRVVSFVSWGTTLSFAAAMIYFVINLYSISNNTLAIKPNPGLALCTIAFIAQTCMVLLIAIAYMSWLRSARLPASTRVALFRMTLLVFVLYLGWFVYIGAMMMTAFRWTLTVPGYAVKGFLIYIGPIILQAAIILMLRIFARLDDGAQMDEGNKLSGEGGDRGLLGSLIDLFRVPTVIRRLFNRNGSHGDSAAVPTTADGEQPVRYGTRHAAAGFSERMARVFSDTDNSTADSGATGAGGYSGVSVAAGDLDGDVIYSNRPSMAVGTRSYLDGTAANGSSSPYTDAVDHFAQSDKHDDNGEDNDGYITQGGYLGGPGAGAHVYIDEVDDDDKIEQYYPRPSTSSHHGL